jgi:hypothetical protein
MTHDLLADHYHINQSISQLSTIPIGVVGVGYFFPV